MDSLHIKKPFMTYEEVTLVANQVAKDSKGVIKKGEPIGTSIFGYSIDKYTMGNGPNHVLVYGATHGCELISTSFILEMLGEISQNVGNYSEFIRNNTLHIIPILNPEGYDIASSAVNEKLKDKTLEEAEQFCRKYAKAYLQDEEDAKAGLKNEKRYRKFFEDITTDCIKNEALRKSVNEILKNTKLPPSTMVVWSSNGVGVDLNSNAPQNFDETKAIKNKKKFTKNRYNDIPINKRSPFNYTGEEPLNEDETPENVALYNLAKELYRKKNTTKGRENLVGIFSYHSTGQIVYVSVDSRCSASDYIEDYRKLANVYSKMADNYKIIEEPDNILNGFTDMLRLAFDGTYTFTLELGRTEANPIGPFGDIKKDFVPTLLNNINALFGTIEEINEICKKREASQR